MRKAQGHEGTQERRYLVHRPRDGETKRRSETDPTGREGFGWSAHADGGAAKDGLGYLLPNGQITKSSDRQTRSPSLSLRARFHSVSRLGASVPSCLRGFPGAIS